MIPNYDVALGLRYFTQSLLLASRGHCLFYIQGSWTGIVLLSVFLLPFVACYSFRAAFEGFCLPGLSTYQTERELIITSADFGSSSLPHMTSFPNNT